jgi:hypothetical protein
MNLADERMPALAVASCDEDGALVSIDVPAAMHTENAYGIREEGGGWGRRGGGLKKNGSSSEDRKGTEDEIHNEGAWQDGQPTRENLRNKREGQMTESGGRCIRKRGVTHNHTHTYALTHTHTRTHQNIYTQTTLSHNHVQ